MKTKRLSLASLLCAGLTVACCLLSPPASATADVDDDREGRELISEGLGIRGVHLLRSTADDVAAAYGKGFEAVEHGGRSVEMRYAALNLSFYYCRADERKRIFAVECRAPFNGFTAKGIVLGKSTVRDVLRAYGAAEPAAADAADHRSFRYPGVEFRVPYKPGRDSASQMLGVKIAAIQVVAEGGPDCAP
jgi:hypothetical protein